MAGDHSGHVAIHPAQVSDPGWNAMFDMDWLAVHRSRGLQLAP
jgi:hypothetical protein